MGTLPTNEEVPEHEEEQVPSNSEDQAILIPSIAQPVLKTRPVSDSVVLGSRTVSGGPVLHPVTSESSGETVDATRIDNVDPLNMNNRISSRLPKSSHNNNVRNDPANLALPRTVSGGTSFASGATSSVSGSGGGLNSTSVHNRGVNYTGRDVRNVNKNAKNNVRDGRANTNDSNENNKDGNLNVRDNMFNSNNNNRDSMFNNKNNISNNRNSMFNSKDNNINGSRDTIFNNSRDHNTNRDTTFNNSRDHSPAKDGNTVTIVQSTDSSQVIGNSSVTVTVSSGNRVPPVRISDAEISFMAQL